MAAVMWTIWMCVLRLVISCGAAEEGKNTGSRLQNHDVNSDINLRIVGGGNAGKTDFPWQIAVFLKAIPNAVHCSGAIISSQWVLTAAQCLIDLRPEIYTIVAGEYNIKGNEGTEYVYNAFQVIRYDKYVPGRSQYDIGLIKIAGKFTYTLYIQPIPLATPSQNNFLEENEKLLCAVSGWGDTSRLGNRPDILQSVQLTLISRVKCAQSYPRQIFEDMICSLGSGLKTPCNGDGGDPLVCSVDGKWILVGIASWSGSVCQYPNFPSVNARVPYFFDWIRQFAYIQQMHGSHGLNATGGPGDEEGLPTNRSIL